MTTTMSSPELVLHPPSTEHGHAGEHYWTNQEARVTATRDGGTVVVEKVRRDGNLWAVTYRVQSGTTGTARTTRELVAALERHLHGALTTGQRQVLTRWTELPEGGN